MKIIEKDDGLYYCKEHDVLLKRDIDSLEFICPADGKKIEGKETTKKGKTTIKIGK